ncbi:hypothetical protein QJS10_CPB18g00274 [Acorus calamus]|uniref:Uncharacterized protein n=1 Tax=Acorus calamus TaxID=4465 RepID=A0AAV9CNE8_ACOCL|nr:hypothetical protein QJS10_CPB18g00274 [Acorus calamus]
MSTTRPNGGDSIYIDDGCFSQSAMKAEEAAFVAGTRSDSDWFRIETLMASFSSQVGHL